MMYLRQFNSLNLPIPNFAYKFVHKMMSDLQAHDIETYEHCIRVSKMALRVAQELKLNPIEQAMAAYSGLLHDLGKMKIPVEIINKPGKLTSEEFDIVKKHTQYGVDLIEPLYKLPFFKNVSDAILYHHERIDGKGYFNITADKIPLCSKIILVVDTVDAMTQDRSYRKGVSFETACDELIRCSGTQFETRIVDAFLEAYPGVNKVASAA